MRGKRPLGLYLHIPFCVRKCAYCDFLSWASTEQERAEYMTTLKKEIGLYQGMVEDYEVRTVFLGGGTPSILNLEQMQSILQQVESVFFLDKTAEITIETNPGTLNKEKLEEYYKLGVNRLSMGLQSTHEIELKCLGRIHHYEDFLTNYEEARKIGFFNINVDLMFGLPGQTLQSWEMTLNRIIELHPKHISAYSLILEKGTEFAQRYGGKGKEKFLLPEEETERQMYDLAEQLLKQAGYVHYEISNYALPGYESKHNTSYWTGVEYLGLGLGSSSLIEDIRFKNESNLQIYKSSIEELQSQRIEKICSEQFRILRREVEVLKEKDRQAEFMFLGLRMCDGIEKKEFEDRFHVTLESVYGSVIAEWIHKKMLCETEKKLLLTKRGVEVSNVILADFLQD